MRGLCEDGNRVGHVGAEIDRADVERFGQRQAAREFMPRHAQVQRRERLLERAARLEQRDERRRFLITDTQRGWRVLGVPPDAGGAQAGGQHRLHERAAVHRRHGAGSLLGSVKATRLTYQRGGQSITD